MSDLLRRYRAERLPVPMVATVAVSLAAAAQAGAPRSLAMFPADAALALLLFVQFRLLDDLADRPRDTRTHPGRVLVRARSARPVAVLGAGLACVTTAALAGVDRTGAALAAYLLLLACLLSFYTLRRNRTLVSDHLLLAKYPAVVWIVARARADMPIWQWSSAVAARLALALAATYLAACLYEALHDRTSPGAARPALLAGEALLLVMTLTALSLGAHA